MAAVTITTQSRMHVLGDRRCKFYKLTIADTNTLTVAGLKNVQHCSVEPVASATAVGVSGIVGNVVTFTAGGTVTGATVAVFGN